MKRSPLGSVDWTQFFGKKRPMLGMPGTSAPTVSFGSTVTRVTELSSGVEAAAVSEASIVDPGHMCRRPGFQLFSRFSMSFGS